VNSGVSVGRVRAALRRLLVERTSELFSRGRWALALAWSVSPQLTGGMVGASVASGVLPAGLALTGRGLIDALMAGLGGGDPGTRARIAGWLGLGLGLALAGAAVRALEALLERRLRDELGFRVASDIIDHAGTLDLASFEDPRFQDVLERARQGTADNVHRFLLAILGLGTNLAQALSLFAILVVVEPLAVPVLFLLAAPYLAYQWRMAQHLHALETSRTTKRRWSEYFLSRAIGRDSLGEVRLLGLAPLLSGRFKSTLRGFIEQDRALHRRNFAGAAVFGALSTLAVYGMFSRVVARALERSLSVGDVAVFGGAAMGLRNSVENTVMGIRTAFQHTLFISHLEEFLRTKPRLQASGGREPASPRGEVELDGVRFRYPGSETCALDGVSLHIRPGETLAIVGENGSGKSTLLKLLARLYDPDEGSIRFDGVDLRELALERLQREIAFVFQTFGRYEASVAENIAYGDWRRLLDDREAVAEVARRAGVDALIAALPDGLDTRLGRAFGQVDLSGGQWQAIAVARAFARPASLLILDEPTASLDARAEHGLFLRFRELARGRTTILVSHRFSTVAMADRIAVLEEGRIVECGTHGELLARGGAYAGLYALHRRQLDGAGPV
jgi:ABC-type multidrug transport system fused ATPase/permease subunit